VCVCVCVHVHVRVRVRVHVHAMFVNASHKTDIHFYKDMHKNEWHDYGEYIYPLSISKLREGYALSKCFSLNLDLEGEWL